MGRSLLRSHSITEHPNQRQAHEHDGDVSLHLLRLPVVDRSHLQVMLGDSKRRFDQPQAVIVSEQFFGWNLVGGQTGVDAVQAVPPRRLLHLLLVQLHFVFAVDFQKPPIAAIVQRQCLGRLRLGVLLGLLLQSLRELSTIFSRYFRSRSARFSE